MRRRLDALHKGVDKGGEAQRPQELGPPSKWLTEGGGEVATLRVYFKDINSAPMNLPEGIEAYGLLMALLEIEKSVGYARRGEGEGPYPGAVAQRCVPCRTCSMLMCQSTDTLFG